MIRKIIRAVGPLKLAGLVLAASLFACTVADQREARRQKLMQVTLYVGGYAVRSWAAPYSTLFDSWGNGRVTFREDGTDREVTVMGTYVIEEIK